MANIDETDIVNQLRRVTEHSMFVRSPRIIDLLTYLINEELSGRGAKLKGYTVGIEALGKADDFDPSSDASVRVETGRLRRMLKNYYMECGADPVLIEIPKGSYQPVFSLLNDQQDPEITRATTPSAGPSIAILPFGTTSADEREKIFAIGIREEMLAELFQYREFHYVDASGIQEEGQDLAQTCRIQFEAEFMLRGQVHNSGDQVVTTLSVTDLTINRLIWVERFESITQSNTLIEDSRDMARAVVHKLVKPAGVLLVKAMQKRMGVHPANWTATDCILRWHYYRILDRSPPMHGALREQIKRIVDVDPMFSMGKVIYSMLKIDEAVYLLNPTDDAHTALNRARYYVLQALSADPEIPWGHYIKSQCDYFSDDLESAQRSARRALDLNPRNTDLQHHVGVFTALAGNSAEGLALIEQAGMKYHTGVGYRLGHILAQYFWGDPMEAKTLFETGLIPNQLSVGQLAGCLAYLAAGDVELAAERYRKVHELEGIQSRSVSDLIDLWIKDPKLNSQVREDFDRLSQTTGLVVKLR